MQTFTFTAADGTTIAARKWPVKGRKKTRGVLQIAHGMAEHSKRYSRFAEFLNSHGITVYAHDHRGHGETALANGKKNHNELGYYADNDGWRKVTDDIREFTQLIRNENPGLPLVLFGHSMGSFLSQQFVIDYGSQIDGLILSASHGKTGPKALVGEQITVGELLRKGPHFRSPIIIGMTFGSFNKAFKPARTESDWLSRDPAEVDKYINDPLCGFNCQTRLWLDLLRGMRQIHRPDLQQKIPNDLPVLIFGGSEDPVTEGPKGLEQLKGEYQRAGLHSVELKVYPGARHELLNETNRDEVMSDLEQWVTAVFERSGQ